MAMYEFKCDDCKIIQEEEHPMKDAPSEATCVECGKTIKRYYSSCNFALKGGGWPSKNIKAGARATAENEIEAESYKRKQKGMRGFDKEVPMSDKEFERRKKLNQRFIEENS